MMTLLSASFGGKWVSKLSSVVTFGGPFLRSIWPPVTRFLSHGKVMFSGSEAKYLFHVHLDDENVSIPINF